MACSSYALHGLARDCASSIGGIKRVLFADAADVASIALTDNEVSAITMVASKKFYEFAFPDESGTFTTTLNRGSGGAGSYLSTEMSLVFNRMATAKRVEMEALSFNELMAIVEDNNGKYWLLGDEHPVVANGGTGTPGTAYGDANQYAPTFACAGSHWPYEVKSSIIGGLL